MRLIMTIPLRNIVFEKIKEENSLTDIVTDQINAGMYIFKRKVIDTIATGRVVSVEREVFPNLLKAGLKGAFEQCMKALG